MSEILWEDPEEVRRATKMLGVLAKALGLSHEELDEGLGMEAGYHGRLFGGSVELKPSHLAAVLHALGFDPKVFSRALHPDPGEPTYPGTMMERFEEALDRLGYGRNLPKPPIPSAVDSEELERKIREVVAEALRNRPPGKKPEEPEEL